MEKSRSIADGLLCSVMSQLSYRVYHWTYISLLEKKPRFCPLRVYPEAKKTEVINKCRQNFRAKQSPHNAKPSECHKKPNGTW